MELETEWMAPCNFCQSYWRVLYSVTDLVEYIETHKYEVRWTCPGCDTLLSFELTPPGARFGLNHGCRHVIVEKVYAEKHAGGPVIDEDAQIDFWESWQPKPDESPDEVYKRLWAELEPDRRELQK